MENLAIALSTVDATFAELDSKGNETVRGDWGPDRGRLSRPDDGVIIVFLTVIPPSFTDSEFAGF